MITGFNTDIEHNGVIYHVQTEDKGAHSPVILSLVYRGGAILASKRTPYDDLVAAGMSEGELAKRLQRQHRLICAAINAGRIEDLRRMGSGAAATASSADVSQTAAEQTLAPATTSQTLASTISGSAPPVTERANGASPLPQPSAVSDTVRAVKDGVADFVQTEAATSLYLSLLGEHEFKAGTKVDLLIRLSRQADGSGQVADAVAEVKILGTSFRSFMVTTKTDADGIAHVTLQLPHFTRGRAALLISATVDGYVAELRRIVHAA